MLLAFLYLCLAILLGSTHAAQSADWRGRSVYFLLTDRFARTDNSTTAPCNVSNRAYCGGTWRGIINQLDYIQNMGFTAIWITPVTAQILGNTGDGTAYHGYWQQNLYNLNPQYGTADDLKALAAALHKRNMYLMVDVVANHFGYAGNGAGLNPSSFSPFNNVQYFHRYCEISNYNNQTDVEDCWLGDTTVALADLNTTRSDVRTYYQNWIKTLVSNYSIDGLRIDTVKHVEMSFWQPFQSAAGTYAVGEVFEGDPNYVCPYQNVLSGLLNYPIYYPLINAFQSGGSISNLYNMINQMKSTCADSTLMGTFMENHDNPRFPSMTGDLALVKNALAFTILSDGIPIIYAGQEQHYSGGSDPNNREATWLSGYSRTAPLYTFIAQTNQIRNQAIYKSSNYLTYMNYPIYQDSTTIAMRKGFDGNQVVAVLSNLGAGGNSYTFSLGNTGYTSGEQVVEMYSCQVSTIDSNGNLAVQMGGGLPKVFYPRGQLSNSGICGF